MGNLETKREMVIRNAIGMFGRKGYYGIGINEIVESCGIPKGSFYYYFPRGKKQLAAEVLDYAYDHMEQSIDQNNFQLSNDPVTIFSKMIDRLSVSVLNDECFLYSLMITFLGIESVYLDPEIAATANAIYRKWQLFYQNKLIQCGISQEKAPALAQMMFSLVHGSLISSWVKRDAADLQLIKSLLPAIFSGANLK